MDKHIEVIGVDHGWSGMKTVSQVFTTGVKEITTEPAFFNNVVEHNGSYYKVGGKRLEVRDLKVENDNFYILKLVEADLQYGLSIEETEQYTGRKYDFSQMKVYSACLRNGYPKEVRECITREGLTGEQMAVALEFYEKGMPVKTIAEITQNSGQTAFVMKKLFQNVVNRVQEAGAAIQEQDGYVAIPVVAPIALGGFYSFNGMSFYEVMGKKIRMLFGNHPLTYVSTEGEAAIKEWKQEEAAKSIADKKKKGKKTTQTKGNQEEFEAMKKKTKKMAVCMAVAMVLAVIGAVIYKMKC